MGNSEQHTPGSWMVDYAHIGNSKGERVLTEIFIRRDGDDVAIASDICDPITGPSEANARLIAAAPDLLEALENLENDAGQIPDHAWLMIQNALAKAKGKEAL